VREIRRKGREGECIPLVVVAIVESPARYTVCASAHGRRERDERAIDFILRYGYVFFL
jgi:hypothetical protein